MQSSSVNTTYAAVADGPEYVEANRGFTSRASLGHVGRFLDLACGTGLVSRMLLGAAPDAFLNGIDLDPVQIDLATKEFTRLGWEVRHGFGLAQDRAGGRPVVTLAVAAVDELPFADATFDCVTIANAIHMMPDKPKFVRAARRVLRPGGLFGFNSVFYAGCNPPGTEQHFLLWGKEALTHLKRMNEQLVAEGKEPIKRVHQPGRRAFQNRWFSPDDWRQLLTETGFTVSDVHERRVLLGEDALTAFGAYSGIVEVVMGGYPLDVGAQVLQATAGASLRALGLTQLPRNWLEVWAMKV